MKNKIDKKQNKGEIIIYQSKDGEAVLEVNLQKETVWLSLDQIATIFNRDKSVISRHIRNIFQEKELNKSSVVAKIATTAADGKTYQIDYYNLDMILSVGYRVNSKCATQFRIWATKILKHHILQGYTINEKRLLETRQKFEELQNAIIFLQKKSQKKELQGQEKEILNLLSDYSKTFSILEQYDKGKFKKTKGKKAKFILKYHDCSEIISELKKQLMLRKEASKFFANEIDKKLEAIVKNLYQTFDSKELYPGIQEKAAHLLYFIIKDHPFIDGNKRSASFLFVYFLDKNNYLYSKTGRRKINDNGLTALALLIAQSDPKEKDVLIKIIINLLNE
jgi:hypothetical protein